MSLPEILQEQVLKNAPDARLVETRQDLGGISLEELRFISRLAAMLRPQRIFELGAFDDRTTLNLAVNAPAAFVHTLDGEAADLGDEEVDERWKDRPEGGRIIRHGGKAADFDFSRWPNIIDLVLLDAGRRLEHVRKDSESALGLVRAEGAILWHRYPGCPAVREALEDLQARDGRFKNLRHVGGTSFAILSGSQR